MKEIDSPEVYTPTQDQLDRSFHRVVTALQRCRNMKMNVPENPPVFTQVEDVVKFKKQCLNLNSNELGTLCYLNDLCDTELLKLQFLGF